MSTQTLTSSMVLKHHGIAAKLEHPELECPVLTGPQAQGDVLIVPIELTRTAGKPIPAAGVTVVRGETAGGNAHLLHALDGECYWAGAIDDGEGLSLGVLTVPADCSATLIHTEEHSVLAIGPGSYELRRQREFAGLWRRVSD